MSRVTLAGTPTISGAEAFGIEYDEPHRAPKSQLNPVAGKTGIDVHRGTLPSL